MKPTPLVGFSVATRMVVSPGMRVSDENVPAGDWLHRKPSTATNESLRRTPEKKASLPYIAMSSTTSPGSPVAKIHCWVPALV